VPRLLLAVALAATAFSATGARAAGDPRFVDGVAAILRTRCVRCHGAEEAHNGLRLDSYDAVMRGAEDGPVIVPGDPKASLLLQKVLRVDSPAMPPKKKLLRAEIKTIRKWIESGALP